MNTQSIIRQFNSSDRDPLFKIAADTAYFGEPIEAYLDDRNLFLDSFYAYYTDYEPEHCWVAEVQDNLVGFITGGIDHKRQEEIIKTRINPKVRTNLLKWKYKIGVKTVKYGFRLLHSNIQKEGTTPDLNNYPTHLHINVAKEWRGYGIGRVLIETYLRYLQDHGFPGVYLQTTSLNTVAVKLYEKTGFSLLESKLSSTWKHFTKMPVYNLLYGKRIGATEKTTRN